MLADLRRERDTHEQSMGNGNRKASPLGERSFYLYHAGLSEAPGAFPLRCRS